MNDVVMISANISTPHSDYTEHFDTMANAIAFCNRVITENAEDGITTECYLHPWVKLNANGMCEKWEDCTYYNDGEWHLI